MERLTVHSPAALELFSEAPERVQNHATQGQESEPARKPWRPMKSVFGGDGGRLIRGSLACVACHTPTLCREDVAVDGTVVLAG